MNLIDIDPLAVACGTFVFIAVAFGGAGLIGWIFNTGKGER